MPLKCTKSSPVSLARSTNHSAAPALRASAPKSDDAGVAVEDDGFFSSPHEIKASAVSTATRNFIGFAQRTRKRAGPQKGPARSPPGLQNETRPTRRAGPEDPPSPSDHMERPTPACRVADYPTRW